MISARLGKNRFYGWIALAGTMSVIISMVGNVVVSYSIFLPTMCDELGWSRSIVSAPFSVFWVVMGMLGPLVGASTGCPG